MLLKYKKYQPIGLSNILHMIDNENLLFTYEA